MSPILNHLPDLPGDVAPIPVDPVDLWFNDIRLDNYLKDRITHIEIIDLGEYEGSSSSASGTSHTYYGLFTHPIASIELVDPDALFRDDHLQPVYTDLPGRTGGKPMNSQNYLTYPGYDADIPGDLQEQESSSSA